MIKIAVLGYGTVGSGVVKVMDVNRDLIAKRVGEPVEVKYILDIREFPGDPYESKLVRDFDTILNDPEVSVVAETMGGTGAAYDFSKRALLAGKNVCTSNKALVAEHGTELMRIAEEKSINYLFEASCGGGIPIMRGLYECLTADEIDEITGILNGTTNFILTKMEDDGSDFEDVLKEAQRLGYAEADPTADVEGHDAQRKIAILSSVALGKFIDYKDVYVEGITKITAADIAYAKALGKTIRLLATSKTTKEGTCARVCPVMIGPEYILYSVRDVFNGVYVHGNMAGDTMFFGSGAGSLPTASAVSADIVECAKNLHHTVMQRWSEEKLALLAPGSISSRFFVRAAGAPEENRGQISTLFGSVEYVSIPEKPDETAFITGIMTEADFAGAAEKMPGMITRIRVR